MYVYCRFREFISAKQREDIGFVFAEKTTNGNEEKTQENGIHSRIDTIKTKFK